jgi:dTDP-4-dehydrorhamnose reductase
MTGPILVFGAGGQLGQEIADFAACGGFGIIAARRADADILDQSAVAKIIEKIAPRLIVNCAAYTAVDKAEREPETAAAINITGASVVAGEAAKAKVPLVHISTDYVFDGTKEGPYLEGDAIKPLNVYGRTKAEGEAAVSAAGGNHIILRTAWVYGRFGHNFLKTILRLSSESAELRVVGDQRGCPTATQDIAAAIFAIDETLAARRSVQCGVYHFVGEGVTSWFDFAHEIVAVQAKSRGYRPRVTEIKTSDYPTPARRPQNSELDSSRFAKTFNFRAAPWRQRVDETVAALI